VLEEFLIVIIVMDLVPFLPHFLPFLEIAVEELLRIFFALMAPSQFEVIEVNS